MLPAMQMIQFVTDSDVDAMMFSNPSSPLVVSPVILLFVLVGLFFLFCAITFHDPDA